MELSWVRAASVDDLELGLGYETDVEIDGEIIGLFNIEGQYYALGECTHENGPLSQGMIEGYTVTCPWHSARFDIKTGRCLGGPSACRVSGEVILGGDNEEANAPDCRSYEVKVDAGEIYVRKRQS